MTAALSHEPPRASDALPVGTNLSGDQFTITAQLGAGGFGITYRAMDNILNRTIVIKECFSEDFCYRDGSDVVARSPDYDRQFKSIVKMFMREAQSLAMLRHPNIVGVHRAFEENETAYMVLDLIDGFDLFEILNTTLAPLPVDGVTEILLQLLDAIEKVHDLDLLHRDISPDNIIIDKSGVPVLIDFGAARGDASRRTRAVSSLLVVKDGYSPNEFYIPGSRQSQCSDLYALGATFYHAISGAPPVNSQARMIDLGSKRPDPCKPLAGRFNDYDPVFLEAIDKVMQVHPEDRLQTAAGWRDMIQGCAKSEGTPVVPLPIPSPAPASPEKIEISLTELVESTNDEVRRTRMIEVAPTPKQEPAKSSTVPDWVKEFNQDSTAQPRDRGAVQRPVSDNDAPEMDHSDVPDQDEITAQILANASGSGTQSRPHTRVVETDWVGRVLEKRERTRMMEAEAMPEAAKGIVQKMQRKPSEPRSAQVEDSTPAKDISIGQMVKVLFAGITIGLIVILGAFWVLPMLNLGA